MMYQGVFHSTKTFSQGLPKMAPIEVIHVNYSYKHDRSVLKSVSLVVAPGEWVGLVGSNGSGKSTLGRLLAGTLLPDTGEVRIDGVPTNHNHEASSFRQRIAIIYADPENQFITSTVADEIAFALQIMEYDSLEIRGIVEDALKEFDLLDYRDTHPFYLSVGEQFRVLLAAAWVRRPQYLILDEFFSMMDGKAREKFLVFLHRLTLEYEIGVVLITHRMEELPNISRLVVLSRGTIAFDGPITEGFSFLRANPDLGVETPILYQVAQHLSAEEREGLGLNYYCISMGW
jgi:energy-coupling factor transport system ATP-binding protein